MPAIDDKRFYTVHFFFSFERWNATSERVERRKKEKDDVTMNTQTGCVSFKLRAFLSLSLSLMLRFHILKQHANELEYPINNNNVNFLYTHIWKNGRILNSAKSTNKSVFRFSCVFDFGTVSTQKTSSFNIRLSRSVFFSRILSSFILIRPLSVLGLS